MFDFIRNHQRLMQFFLALIIVPSFAFVGLGSYSSFRDADNAVAKVAGRSITQQEWDAAQREQMNRYRQMMGPRFDPKMFDTPEMKQRALDNLVAKWAGVEVARNRLTVPDNVLQEAILGIPGLTLPDGKFDSKKYQTLLAAQGMTPASYTAQLRQDMVLQQLNTAVQATAFAPKALAIRLSEINGQEREVQELALKAAEYSSQVKLADDLLKDYYSKNSKQFEIPDQAKAEYVVLSGDAIGAQISISDDEVKARYEANVKSGLYVTPEERRASHILITVKKDATAAEKASAKAKIEGLLAELHKSPANFAKLAKENSQDAGSAELNGDLGFFKKGMMLKPFEDAAYKLKQGEISGLVETDYGYHIIELTGIKPSSVKSLDEVKNALVTEMKKPLVAKKYSEMAETFNNTVYEQADSLKPVADKLGLKIETVPNLTPQPNPSLPATVVFNNPKLLKALFSDEAIKNKHNTEAVEVAPNTLVSARIVEYKPASKRPFEEVREIIRASVTQIEAVKLAVKAGEAKLAVLKTKDDPSGFSPSKAASRNKPAGLTQAVLAMVMKTDVTTLPTYVGMEVPGQGYGLYRISKIIQPPALDAAHLQSEQQQVTNTLAQQEMFAYVEALKQKAKVKILKSVSSDAAGAEGKAIADSEAK